MKKIIVSQKLQKFKEISHGFGTKNYSLKSKNVISLNQVHGNKIMIIDKIENKKTISADGVLTRTPGIFLIVKTADCVPILFYESKKQIIGVLHAGWRGTLKNIVTGMVVKILANGGHLEYLFCAIGPSIGGCCYKVTKERAKLFQKKIKNNIIIRKENTSYFLDLKKVNELLLLKAGVKKENLDISKYCTFCQSKLFYSLRRDHEIKDMMINFITLKV